MSTILQEIRNAIDDSVEGKDGIDCDWTQDAYDRVMEILDAIEANLNKKQ